MYEANVFVAIIILLLLGGTQAKWTSFIAHQFMASILLFNRLHHRSSYTYTHYAYGMLYEFAGLLEYIGGPWLHAHNRP